MSTPLSSLVAYATAAQLLQLYDGLEWVGRQAI
jgi:hypothetical protein